MGTFGGVRGHGNVWGGEGTWECVELSVSGTCARCKQPIGQLVPVAISR